MFYSVYILYSEQLDRYYCGMTQMTVAERLARHNSKHCGYTGKVSDWHVVTVISCASHAEALQLERKIKKRGIQRYLDG